MSIAKANRQKYKEDYIKHGFTCFQKDGQDIPQCVLCTKTLFITIPLPAQATFEQCSQGAS